MKRNKRKKNVTWQSGSLTTSRLLKKMFAGYGWGLEECRKDQCYGLLLETENGEIENIFFDTFNEYSFIRIMVFQWHEVKMADVEEVARIQSAINMFNRTSRAKVFYKVTGDIMTLSTIMNCRFGEEIPDIGAYLFAQIDTVRDAREFIFPSDEKTNLPWHNIPVPPQSKPIKDIVLDTLKELNCKPDVEPCNDHCDSIAFNFQTEPFDIRVIPTNGFVLLLGPVWYSFDATDVDKLSVVKSIVNELNWDSRVNVVYWIEDGRCEVGFRVFMTCVEGIDFTSTLLLTLVNYFHTRNMFHKMFAESSVR